MVSIALDNDLVPIWWQAITYTYDNPANGLYSLKRCHMVLWV